MSTILKLDATEYVTGELLEDRAPTIAPLSFTAEKGVQHTVGSKVLRFAKSERILHWSIAGPFLVSFVTGVALAVIYNPDPTRPLRNVFAVMHRASGLALTLLPILAALKCRRDARIHFYNIKQAWTWMYDDFKWLALMGLASISSRFKLPEQGKFNAAEKLNFMVLMSTYPLYIATGLLMWFTHLPVLSWILHCLMAMCATPLLLGHLYMALINPSTRPGLEGMISGHVDRQWAKHHYTRWYKKHHEAAEKQMPGQRSFVNAGTMPNAQTTIRAKDPAISADGKSVIFFPSKPAIGRDPSATGISFVSEFLPELTVSAPGMRHEALPIQLPNAFEDFVRGFCHRLVGGRLTYELSPGRFLGLCAHLRNAAGAPALINRVNRENSSLQFRCRMHLSGYRNQQALQASGGMLRIPEPPAPVIAVNTGDFILTSSAGSDLHQILLRGHRTLNRSTAIGSSDSRIMSFLSSRALGHLVKAGQKGAARRDLLVAPFGKAGEHTGSFIKAQ